MNDFTIKTPTIRVPGLLDDDAMQEQLKIFKQSGLNGGATPVPTAAIEMADRVQRDFIDSPLRSAARAAAPLAGPFSPLVNLAASTSLSSSKPAKVDEQQQAIDTRSDVLSSPGFRTFTSLMLGVTAPEGGVIDRWGTLTPEQSEREQQDRVAQAREEETAIKSHVATRQRLRSLTAEEAATLGLPVAPGSDPEADKVLKEQLEQQDQDRLKRASEAVVKAEGGPAPKKTWWLDAINSFDRSFADFFTSVGKSAAIGLLELPGEVTGVRNSGRSDVRAWFDTVDATMQKIIPPDKARDQDFINLLSGGAGSMTGFLSGAMIAKVIGLPAKASSTVIGAASQASVQYEDAEAHKGGELQRLVAFFAGAGLGATEGMPINRMLARAERASGGGVSQLLRHTAAGSLEEFVQELGQNLGQDVVAKWLYDEQRQYKWGDYLKAGAVGAILGGMGGTATATLQRSGLMPETLSSEDRADQELNQDIAARQAFEERQQASMQRVITDAQRQFDTIVGDRPSAEPTVQEAAFDAMGELPPPPSRLAAQHALDVGAALEAAADPIDASVSGEVNSFFTSDVPLDSLSDEAKARIGAMSKEERIAAFNTVNRAKGRYEAGDLLDDDLLREIDAQSNTLPLEGQPLVDLAMRAPKSEAFTNWFGDSKAVDPAGAPLVVYRGEERVFDDSEQGVWFTSDPATASAYAENLAGGYAEGANVIPAYVSIKRPLEVDAGGARYDAIPYEGGTVTTDQLSAIALNEARYDGLIVRNVVDGSSKAIDVYRPVNPTQIKSVNNRGNFDPKNPDILASTSSTRGSYNAEPKRATSGVAGQTDAAGDNVSLRQLADNFTKLLGLTVRQGRFTLKGADVMGQFSTRSGVIRMRTPNDISTLIHEGGHSLETNADGELKTFIGNNRVMLQTIARKLYGGDTTNMPDAQKTSEGFAEFFRVYVTNRRFAEINYPTITADFKTLLDTHNPQLRDGLQLIGDQYSAWLQMPSAQLVRNMVQSGRETTGINAAIEEMRKEGLVNWFKEWVNGVHTAVINRNNNLNTLVADVLNAAPSTIDMKRADDPRVLIRLAANSGQRAIVQLTDGIMPHRSVNPSTPGLRDVLLRYHGKAPDGQLSSIDPERQKDFAAYLVALRGIDEYNRYSQGIIERPPVAATLGDLTTTVSEMETRYGDDFKDAAKMAHLFAMGLWQKSYDAGLIDGETFADGNTRNFYVPLQRDMSDKEVTQSGISASQARQGKSIVKRFRGSDRDIIDPMDALMQKTFALEKVIAENEVKVALAKLADKAGTVGALVERVPAHKLLGEQFSVQEIARQLSKDPTMSQADAADLMNLLEAAIDDGNRIALFRSQQASAAGENIIFFWEKGKLAALQLRDGDVGADIINTLNAVGTESVPFLVDLIAYPSTVFRSAVTSWPDFLLVNFIRDQMSAFVLTEGYTPFVTGIQGVADELRQKDWARQYNAAMGTMGGMNSSTLHDARVKNDIAALRKKGYIAQVFRDKSLGGAARGMARMTELTETGTRLGIFRKAYDRAVTDGLTPWEASVEASYISTDYIDFSLHGNRMLAWRRLIPFLNAQLQGLNKMVRTLAGDEVRQRKGLMFAVSAFFKDTNNLPLSRTERQAVRTGRKAWLKMASLGIIGAVLNAVFEDDPDYQDASEYLRTTGWIIPLGNGHIAYIPKPFELAMVSNFVERGLEAASGDKEAKNRLLRGMAMNLLPPTNPPAIQTLVEQFANWQSFSGMEIVPDYMRALEPELQYNHYTTEFAKQLGSALGWSPMRVDHVMNSLGASAYRDLANLYNMTDPTRPSSDVTDWPMTRRFVRDARRGATSSQDFWKVASTVTGSLRRAETTYKNYIESGREAAAENYLQELEPDERAYALLNTHFKADYKRLNPTYRTRQLTTIISAMRRELYADIGVDNTGVGGEDMPFLLSAKEKHDVDTAFSELARREVRNSLIYMKAPGWANKKPLDTESTIELLRSTSPDMAEEFERRVKKAKVYDADTIREYWPEVRNRLLQDGDEAFLKDLLAVAKAMR